MPGLRMERRGARSERRGDEMRLTTKIATWGGHEGLSRFPSVKTPLAEIFGADGTMDYGKALTALAKTDGVATSTDDDRATVAFAFEFLDRIATAYAELAERVGDHVTVERVNAKKPKSAMSACEKRMAKGRFAFVRVDIRRNADALRVALSWENPKEVVGHAESLASFVAMGYAKNLVAIRDDLAKENGTAVRFVEGANCAGIFAEAEKRNAIEEEAARRANCPHRVAGYCQGVHDCIFRERGYCKAPTKGGSNV